MRILIVGGGGREHALAHALSTDDPTHHIHAAPGNPGIASLATNLDIAATDIDRLADAVDALAIDLTIVGPEAPLAAGLVDRLEQEGRVSFGPCAAAARIESSKAFAKDVMRAAGVRTAASEIFTDLGAATRYIDRHSEPLVVKASGLAAGKGAVVCDTREEARRAATAMLADSAFGDAGHVVVIEEFLEGEELSVLAVTNGTDIRLLAPAQDHKRLLVGDRGPNTGGMGAYAPVSMGTSDLLSRIERDVLHPTLVELAARGAPFRGVLYAGLMIARDGTPHVIEFNCRLGDPEAEVVLPLLDSGLTALIDAAARSEPLPAVVMKPASAVTTVLAAPSYPDAPIKGATITIPGALGRGVMVYHAGTALRDDGELVVNGGRVLAVTAVAPTFDAAQTASRDAARRIQFEGKQMRDDIGWREAKRLEAQSRA